MIILWLHATGFVGICQKTAYVAQHWSRSCVLLLFKLLSWVPLSKSLSLRNNFPYCELSSNKTWCWRTKFEALTAKPEWINIRICPTTPCVILRIIHSRENYFDCNMIHKEKSTSLQCFPKNCFAADVDRSKCLHATSSNESFCTIYVDHGNVSIKSYGKTLTSC